MQGVPARLLRCCDTDFLHAFDYFYIELFRHVKDYRPGTPGGMSNRTAVRLRLPLLHHVIPGFYNCRFLL